MIPTCILLFFIFALIIWSIWDYKRAPEYKLEPQSNGLYIVQIKEWSLIGAVYDDLGSRQNMTKEECHEFIKQHEKGRALQRRNPIFVKVDR